MNYERIVILLLIAALLVVLFRPVAVKVSVPATQPEPATPPATPPATTAAPDTLEVIHNRKSVRSYTSAPVTQEALMTLVRAGMAAPTARNSQPWAFVVITDRKQLDALAEALPSGRMLAKAGGAIAVCGVEKEFLEGEGREMWVQDCSAATENILLAAEATGLGAVWLGVYPNKERVAGVSRVLGLASGVLPLNVISIGYPTGAERPKDKYKPEKIHLNAWNNPLR